MARLLVRNVGDGVKARLKARAVRHGRSLEAEVRDVLGRAAAEPVQEGCGLGTQIAALFAGHGLTRDEADAMELRGHTLEPPTFDE